MFLTVAVVYIVFFLLLLLLAVVHSMYLNVGTTTHVELLLVLLNLNRDSRFHENFDVFRSSRHFLKAALDLISVAF